MNDVYTYPDYGEYDDTFTNSVASEKKRVLGRLATGSVSHLELLCLPSGDAPLARPEIIICALHELEQAHQISKTYELTREGNGLAVYELA